MDGLKRNGSKPPATRIILRLDDGSIIASRHSLYGDSSSDAVRLTYEEAAELGHGGNDQTKRLQGLIASAGQNGDPSHEGYPAVKKQRNEPVVPTKSTSTGGDLQNKNWLEKCKDILSSLVEFLPNTPTPYRDTFYFPVDPKVVPGYAKMVKKPMWLQKVEQRIAGKHYQNPVEVYQDVKLVWKNCEVYNKGNPYGETGKSADAFFEEKWSASGLGDDTTRSKRATAGVAAAKFDPETFENQPKPKASSMSKQKSGKGTDKSQSHEVTSGPKTSEVKFVSEARKAEIAAELSNLSDTAQLEEAMKIVPSNFLIQDSESGELELDFESLDQETLYLLGKYLLSLQHPLPTQPAHGGSKSAANNSGSSSSEESDSDSL